MRKRTASLLVSCLVCALPALAAPVEVQTAGGGATWQISGNRGAATLVVIGADNFVLRASFPSGVAPFFAPPADGRYRWQLQVAPVEGARRVEGRETAVTPGGFVEDGLLVVQGGSIKAVRGDEGSEFDVPRRDQVIADDLIVQGSGCFGFDCVNNESFGFDTIRLKENNLRIKFEDTSASGFPSTDWQLTANDSASGGANKFSIEDVTAATVPFTVEGGTLSNSLFLDSTGKVGFRTTTPVLDLHVATSNTPGIRLEQNNSGGFTAQTWDIAGNEANFFVRDVTSGSRLPFRIRPGAPSSTIDISAAGNVGVGTASASEKLHVNGGRFYVTLNNATNDTVAKFENNEAARMDLRINSTVNGGVDTTWFWQADSDANRTFKISKQGGGGTIVTINNRLDANGTTFVVAGSVAGTAFINTSSRDTKTAFQSVDARQVLEKVAGLDIQQWRFKHEGSEMLHVGPVAEDFAAAFGLGPDDKHINLSDANGITMLAIQGLYRQVQELERRNAELEALVKSANQP